MSPTIVQLRTAIATALIASAWAHAADVTVQPAAGSGFVVKDANGANERLRVQESGAITLPGLPGAAAQSTNLCMNNAGLLGPCSGGSGGSGTSYTAATGLTLTGTTFGIAPTYQLPQGCAVDQVAQWNGATAWKCGAVNSLLPEAHGYGETLYHDPNTAKWATNWQLTTISDGGLLAFDHGSNTGKIPVDGTGLPIRQQGAGMMWYPAKAAFRAEFFYDHLQWDDDSIGPYSIATGYRATANGSGSVAMGNTTTANGNGSIAMGDHTTAGGAGSIAIGSGATTKGQALLAMGSNAVAEGIDAVAIGHNVTATYFAFALGGNLNANQNGCGIIGWNTYGHASANCARAGEVLVSANNGLEVSYNSTPYGTDQGWIIVGAGNAIPGQAIATSTGAWLSMSGTWNNASDRNKKENFTPVDAQGVLDKVVHLPLTTWSYKTDQGKYRHLGPMAQDFYASFGLGQDDISISTIDPAGVALAAIQGLNAKLEASNAKLVQSNATKNDEIAALKTALATQAQRLAALESHDRDLAEIKRQLAALRESVPPPRGIHVALQP